MLPSLRWPHRSLILQALLALLALLAPILLAPGGARADDLPSSGDRWTEVRSENFRILTDARPEGVESLARDLERLRTVLEHLYPQIDVETSLPLRLFVFRDDDRMEPYNLLRSQHEAGSDRLSQIQGYFLQSQDTHYLVVNGHRRADPEQVLYHEFLHFISAVNFPGLPLWLAEGLAEVYSTFAAEGSQVVVGRPVAAHLNTLRLRRPAPLAELLTVDPRTGVGSPNLDATLFYAQSWALTHYLMFHEDPGVWRGLSDFLQKSRQGEEPTAAFEEAFGLPLDDLQGELARYGHRDQLPALAYDLENLPEDGASIPLSQRPVDRAEVLVALGELLTHTRSQVLEVPFVGPGAAEMVAEARQDLFHAREHFEEALEETGRRERLEGQPSPDLEARAHAGLGEILELRGERDGARERYRQALALAPDSARVHTLLGQSLLRDLTGDGNFTITRDPASQALAEEARGHFARAVARPDAPPAAFVGLGTAHLFLDADPTPGIDALRTARRLQPERQDLALNLAVLYTHAGQLDRARGLLGSLAASEDPEIARLARDLLTSGELQVANQLLQEGKPEEAADLMEGLLDQIEDPALRAQVAGQITHIRDTVEDNRWVTRYNEAALAANAGDFDEALRIIDEVLESATEPGLLDMARAMREQLLEVSGN